MQEIWKPIPIEGLEMYQISNYGKVYSPYKKRELTIYKKNNPNYHTKLYNYVNLKSKHYRLCRLVALTFVDNPNNYDTVNHIDEDTENDRADNLEWMSAADNVVYSQGKKVIQKDLDGNIVKIYLSQASAAESIGLVRSTFRSGYLDKERPYKGFYFYSLS